MYRVPVEEGESWLLSRIRRHVSELLRLAAPVIVARAGLLVMAMVDVVFVGRYGTLDLAQLSLANAPVGALIASGTGLLIGTLAMTAKALGQGRPRDCGAIWRRSVVYAGGIGLAGLAICSFGEPVFLALDQSPRIASGAADVMLILGLGLPASLIYTTTAFFLEGLKRPLPGMVAMILANILNVFINWLLVFGEWGMPELGAEGAAWASTIVRVFLALGLVLYVLNMADHAAYGVRTWPGWLWRQWAAQRRIGYGGGASIGIEAGSFASLSVFAGWLGAVALGAYSIGFNLLALVFMVALGIGSATAVRVGIAHGREDAPDLALAGWTGLAVNTAVMIPLGIILWFFPDMIAAFFTTETELLVAAAPLIAITAFILIADGGQVVIANALRGRGDALGPTVAHTISYLIVMVPASWFLALPLGRGVLGLFEGILIASIVSVILLSLRFHHLSRRDLRLMEQPAELPG